MRVTELHPLLRAMLIEPDSKANLTHQEWAIRATADYMRTKDIWEAAFKFVNDESDFSSEDEEGDGKA